MQSSHAARHEAALAGRPRARADLIVIERHRPGSIPIGVGVEKPPVSQAPIAPEYDVVRQALNFDPRDPTRPMPGYGSLRRGRWLIGHVELLSGVPREIHKHNTP